MRQVSSAVGSKRSAPADATESNATLCTAAARTRAAKLAKNGHTAAAYTQTRILGAPPPKPAPLPSKAQLKRDEAAALVFDRENFTGPCIKHGSLHFRHPNGESVRVPCDNCPVCGHNHI